MLRAESSHLLRSAPNEGDFTLRWELMAEAYSSIPQILGRDGGTEQRLSGVQTEMAGFKEQCNLLTKTERATCLDVFDALTGKGGEYA
ncbi:hypothetical protein [Tateyamaria sp.]|uniref:hypothetical protein n=1 Tax=Tateyamaria sp. TaxID=1929288 RepID=UPI00329DD412